MARRKTPAERVRHDTTPDGVAIDISEDKTVARCLECGEVAYPGGDIIPDEPMVRRRWPWCAFGPNWSWCQKNGGKFKRR